MKLCTECNIEKELEEFWFNVKKNSYHQNCKKCKYIKSKKYINVTPEQKAICDKRYREKHYEQLKISKKDEYERNKDKYITRALAYQKTKYGKLKHNIRNRIGKAIKARTNSSKDLLDCEITLYISYLEFQFDNEMSWENYGNFWQIDHVNQICNFNLNNDIEQKKAFNWKNTRPLKTYDNLSRSNKSDINEINNHNKIVDNFLNATL
jgi:hypothetical protein